MNHLERLAKETRLQNSDEVIFNEVELGDTHINISGKWCKVRVFRNKGGNIEIFPIDPGITDKEGWLEEGTCTEGYNDEVIISQYNSGK